MRTPSRKHGIAFGCVVVLSASLVFFASRQNPTPDVTTSVETSAHGVPETSDVAGSGLDWRAGSHQSWSLTLEGTATNQWMPGTEAEGPVAAHASIVARLHAQVDTVVPDGNAVVQFWLEDIQQADFNIGGSTPGSPEGIQSELARAALLVQVDSCGKIAALQNTGEAELGNQMLQSLLEASWPVVCANEAHEAGTISHITPHGTAIDTLEFAPDSGGQVIVLRARTYSTLRAADVQQNQTRVEVESRTQLASGMLRETSLFETLRIGELENVVVDAETTTSLSGHRVHTEQRPVATVSEWRSPGSIEPTSRMAEQLTRQRAGDLDSATLLDTLATWGGSGTVPNHNDFLWRAPARIALDPALAGQIADLITAEDATSAGRGLMLDLLAQTSHVAATDALLASLQHVSVQSDRMYPILMQRVSFVAEPTPALVDWVAQQATQAERPNDRTAAQYALGSLVAALDGNEEAGRADAAHAVLVRSLSSAVTVETQVNAIRAIANAARPTDMPIFTAASTSLAASVRRAAAESLAGLQQAQSTSLLVQLVADTDDAVQRTAITSLREHTLRSATLVTLTSLVSDDTLHPENALPLLDLAKYYVTTAPGEVAALARAVEAFSEDAQTIAAARELARRAGEP